MSDGQPMPDPQSPDVLPTPPGGLTHEELEHEVDEEMREEDA